MGVVSRTVRRSAIGAVAAALALSSTACTVAVEPRSTYSAPSATPSGDAGVGPVGGSVGGTVGQSPAAVLAPVGASAAGLVQLAALGRDRGAGEPVRAAARSLMTIGTDLSAALGRAEPAVLVEAAPDTAATVRDLGARTGDDFDPAWLRAAADMVSGTDAATGGVLASASVPDSVRAAIRRAVAGLGDARAALRAAGVSAGATTPTQVEAGDGGWAGDRTTWITVAGIALVGLGGAMLGSAAVRRRVRR